MPENKFCRLEDLGLEAAVEQFFVSRLLIDLGYQDNEIRPKTSLDELTVHLGRRPLKYKPDYAIVLQTKVRWIVEAKGLNEPLDPFIGQCVSYCATLNRQYPTDNPVKFFILTNGHKTRVYEWDRADPLLDLCFEDFTDEHPAYGLLRQLLSRDALLQAPVAQPAAPGMHALQRKNIEDLNADFAWCHQFIYRKDNLSQAAAFMEFLKIIFLKLLSDRAVHNAHPEWNGVNNLTVPANEVRFSKRWIEEREPDHPNPLDANQFQQLVAQLEEEITQNTRKRIFNRDDHIKLSPDTIKGVVERLQSTDLYGIDADLNGRLFETFLNATMRGKDLGQYFTPRSVVKLATRLATLRANRDDVDTVMDACCGTGGFLIEALSVMWKRIDGNGSLTDEEREQLRQTVAKERLYGVDVAKDPILARIARINMYLHGDGGARIYQVDFLDKQLADQRGDPADTRAERRELRGRFLGGNMADVILTNPPFAKEYERKHTQDATILDRYDLAFDRRGGQRKAKSSLKSSIMFLERYHDVLRPGGRLITVIDDSILGGRKYAGVRDFIRQRFIVRAVVSLPGDAFQRSKARVKTSLLVLQKRTAPNEQQPAVFMYYCTAVGLDDPARQRVLPGDREMRARAQVEVEEVGSLYEAFLGGEGAARAWTVPAQAIANRMDVKSCLVARSRSVDAWRQAGHAVENLADVLEVIYPVGDEAAEDEVDQAPAADGHIEGEAEEDGAADAVDEAAAAEEGVAVGPLAGEPGDQGAIGELAELVAAGEPPGRLLRRGVNEGLVTHLVVRYNGSVTEGETIEIADSSSPELFRVEEGDIVLSNINAVNGAVGVVPPELADRVVTNEYTVCRAREGIDARALWVLLRSPEVRSDLLVSATGIGRNRVKWETMADVQVPLPDATLHKAVVDALTQAEELERKAQELRDQVQARVNDQYGLDNEEAQRILVAFKPPR